MRPLLAALVVIGFAGCGPGAAAGLEATPTGSVVACGGPTIATRERLELDAMSFRVHPVSSLGSFSSRRVLAGDTSRVPLQLADGWFEAHALSGRAGPLIAVMRFGASLDDVKFTEAQLPPSGLTLTQVSFATVGPQLLPARWLGDGNVGVATGSLTVEVHTSLALSNGKESPLEVARLEVPVELTVIQTANRLLGLSLQVAREGPLWNWAGLFELSDLTLSLEAYQVGRPDQLPPGVELN